MAAPRKPAKAKRPAKATRNKPDPDIEAFGNRLRALRKEAGMTQEALAAAAGLHWTYIGQIERGRRNLTLKNVLRLARGLGVEPARLIQ